MAKRPRRPREEDQHSEAAYARRLRGFHRYAFAMEACANALHVTLEARAAWGRRPGLFLVRRNNAPWCTAVASDGQAAEASVRDSFAFLGPAEYHALHYLAAPFSDRVEVEAFVLAATQTGEAYEPKPWRTVHRPPAKARSLDAVARMPPADPSVHAPPPLPYDEQRIYAGATPEHIALAQALKLECSGAADLAGWADATGGGRMYAVRRNGWPWSAHYALSGRAAEAAAAGTWGPATYQALEFRMAPFADLVGVVRRAHDPGFAPEP